jgi:hypothetical protein
MNAEEIIYDNTFEKTLEILKLRSMNKEFSIDILERELNSLYVYEELDWTGRGEIKSSEISGAVLAYQVFINDWKNQKDCS